MKTLLALIVLALLLAGGYWKVQNPDAGIDELARQAQGTIQRFKRGVDVVVDGDAAAGTGADEQADELAARLSAVETTLAEAPVAKADEFAARLNAVETTLADAPVAKADEFAARLSAVETTLADAPPADNDGEPVQAQLDAIDARVSEMQRGNETNRAGNDITVASIEDLSSSVDTLRARLNEALDQAALSGAAAPAEQAAGPSSSQADAIRANEESQAAMEARLRELDARMAALAKVVETAKGSAPEASASAEPATAAAMPSPVARPAAEQSEESPARSQAPAKQVQAKQAEAGKASAKQAQPEQAPAQDEPQSVAALAKSVQTQKARSTEYKIYFNLGGTGITDEAADVLDSFVVQEKNRATDVSIFGLTDQAGSAEHNQLVSDRRARSVRDYLVQNGFDAERIETVTGLGEEASASVLDEDQTGAQSRAVLLFAAQP